MAMDGDDMDMDDLLAEVGAADSDFSSDDGLPEEKARAGAGGAAEGAHAGPHPVGEAWGRWRQYYDPMSQNHYYANSATGEVSWTPPADAPECAFKTTKAQKPASVHSPVAAYYAVHEDTTDVSLAASFVPKSVAEVDAHAIASVGLLEAFNAQAANSGSFADLDLLCSSESEEEHPAKAASTPAAVPVQNAAMEVAFRNATGVPSFAGLQPITDQAAAVPVVCLDSRTDASAELPVATEGQAEPAAELPALEVMEQPALATPATTGSGASNPESDLEVFGRMSHHRTMLSFKDLRLASIEPLHLEAFPRLSTLCLSGNEFANVKELASQLSRLDALNSLDISRCRLKQLPLLVHCHALEHFDASENAVSSSRGLIHCTSLRRVRLGSNRIRHMEQLETLQRLEDLDVSKNQLGPTATVALRILGACKALLSLNVAGNPFAKAEHRGQVRNLIPSLVLIDGKPLHRKLPAKGTARQGTGQRGAVDLGYAPDCGRKPRAASSSATIRSHSGAAVRRSSSGGIATVKVAGAARRLPAESAATLGRSNSTSALSSSITESPVSKACLELSDLAIQAAEMQREIATMFSRPRTPSPASTIVEPSLLSLSVAESPAPLRCRRVNRSLMKDLDLKHAQDPSPIPSAVSVPSLPCSHVVPDCRSLPPQLPTDGSLLCSLEPSGPCSPVRACGRRLGVGSPQDERQHAALRASDLESRMPPFEKETLRPSLVPQSPELSTFLHADLTAFSDTAGLTQFSNLAVATTSVSPSLSPPSRRLLPTWPGDGQFGSQRAADLGDLLGEKRRLLQCMTQCLATRGLPHGAIAPAATATSEVEYPLDLSSLRESLRCSIERKRTLVEHLRHA